MYIYTLFFFLSSQHPCSSDRGSKPIYPQVAVQILQKPAIELRCPSRAWKVKLVGEGADDAGGVFDETIAQMCEVSLHATISENSTILQ